MVPEAVSDAVVRGVRRILHMGKMVRFQIGQHVLPRAAEDGADEEIPLRRDAAEAGEARAAEEIQKHCLQIVVRRMGGGDALPEGGEECVAQVPRGFFEGFAGFPGACGGVAGGDGERHAPIGAEGADEDFIAVGFRAAELMVEVRGGDGQAEFCAQIAQHMQHGDGICAAGDGADDRLARCEQGGLPAEAAYLIPHASTPDSRTWCTAGATGA